MGKASAKTRRQRVAVIIIHQQKILLLYRYKNGRTYYVIPGEGVKRGESIEQTGRREVKEEVNLKVTLGPKWYEYNNDGLVEHYFLAQNFKGEVKLGGPELLKQSPQNIYRPEWIPLSELKDIPLMPPAIKEKIITELAPAKPASIWKWVKQVWPSIL
jgi:8-oxo-dGTP diphosphatase